MVIIFHIITVFLMYFDQMNAALGALKTSIKSI